MTSSQRVYKFYSARWGLDALYRDRLKVTTESDINDPFEFLAAGKGKASRKEAKINRANLFKTGGIISFSRNWREPLLWSHYADNHRGLALGFDLTNPENYSVKYTGARVRVPPDNNVTDNLDGNYKFQKELGTTKYKRWEYEGEVRMFPAHSGSVVENGLYFRPFSKIGPLKQVILGADYQSKENMELLKKLNSQGVEIITARLSFKTFSVVEQKNQKYCKDL